eukprot:UN11595
MSGHGFGFAYGMSFGKNKHGTLNKIFNPAPRPSIQCSWCGGYYYKWKDHTKNAQNCPSHKDYYKNKK